MEAKRRRIEPLVTVEKPNTTLLRRAVYSVASLHSWNLIPEAIALIDAADKNDGCVTVEWHECANGAKLRRETGEGYRLYPAGPSMARLDRQNTGARNIAQFDSVIPVDLVNCHPTILAERDEAICEYVEHREDALQKVSDHYGVTRDEALRPWAAGQGGVPHAPPPRGRPRPGRGVLGGALEEEEMEEEMGEEEEQAPSRRPRPR